jgi:hypothetical protein
MIPFFVLPSTLPVVLASSSSGDKSVNATLYRLSPHQNLGRAGTAGNRLDNYPENCLVKPPRRDTRTLSPASKFERKAPLRLAAQKS